MPDHRFLWLLIIFLLTACGVVGFLYVTNGVEDYGKSPATPQIIIPTEVPTATPTIQATSQYQNPFEVNAQVITYTNPFNTYQNPFDEIQ